MSPARAVARITEPELTSVLQSIALHLSRVRKSERLNRFFELDQLIPSTDAEMRADWHNATILFASKVVVAELRLTTLEMACYRFLEQVWLDDVKQQSAYFGWLNVANSGGEWWSDDQSRRNHYLDACNQMRLFLIDRHSKDRLGNFSHIREYLASTYFDEYSKPDPDLMKPLTEKKSNRLIASGLVAPPHAEVLASQYVSRFYGNIVPAVDDDNVTACSAVLQALQHGGSLPNLPGIISSFEAAVVIAFLNETSVQELWRTGTSVSKETTF